MRQLSMLLWIVLLISFCCGLFAQKIPKFGKVSKETLAMTELAADPEADAVFLFEVGDLSLRENSGGYYIEVYRHARIKILTEEGKDYADISIPYWHEDKIRDFKAHTVLPNGKKVKVKKKSVFEERDNKIRYKKFTFPGVEVGSVIEYKYKLESKYFIELEPWYFQNSAYTLVSRYSVTILPYFHYNAFFLNEEDQIPEEEEILDVYTKRKLTKFSWTLTDLPPIREEPYMRSLNDYRAALYFQIEKYSSPYSHRVFIKDWPTLVKEMRDLYDKYLGKDKSLQAVIDAELSDSMQTADKIRVLYEYVRDNVETSEQGNIYTKSKAKNVLKEKKGTAAQKNLLLVNLLEMAGFDAHPVLISSRYNGRMVQRHARLNQFNRMLVYVKSGMKTYMLDTRLKNCPFKMLPVDDIVETGLVINRGEGGFVKIPAPRQVNMEFCETKAALDEEGNISAELMIRFDDYRAMRARNRIKEDGEKSFVSKLLKNRYETAELDTFSIDGFDEINGPVTVNIKYDVEGFAQVVGDMIYLSSPAINQLKENPFKREKRYYPVDYGYAISSTDNVSLKLPEGFHVNELPQAVSSRLKIQKLTFQNTWEDAGDTINIRRQMMVRKQMYTPKEYTTLRNFYDKIVKADQGQIVLSSSTPTAGE